MTRTRLDELPLDRIKDMTQGRLRLTAIEQAAIGQWEGSCVSGSTAFSRSTGSVRRRRFR